MCVLIKNADITLYHFNPKTQKYTRFNINGVNWNSKRNATVTDKGVNVAYTTKIIADKGEYTVSTGDKVVKGNIALDILKASDLGVYNPITVIGIQENNIFKTLTIECK